MDICFDIFWGEKFFSTTNGGVGILLSPPGIKIINKQK